MILVPQIITIHYQMLMLFCKSHKKLGINKDSKIVVYDGLGIYTVRRQVVIHHYGT
jgi:3-mercaptopyruvate sulfurtransferase SseA